MRDNTVMISLVGKQPMPNLIGAEELKPQKVIFLCTQQVKYVYEDLKELLEEKGIECEYELVAPWDYEGNKSRSENLFKKASQSSVILNLTGGTKVMALAAFSTAIQHEAKVIYVDGAEDCILSLFPNQTRHKIEYRADVSTFLHAHGIKILQTGETDELFRDAQIRRLVIDMGLSAQKIKPLIDRFKKMHSMRNYGPNKYRLRGKQPARETQADLLDRLDKVGYVEYLDRQGKTVTFRVIPESFPTQFLLGHWLELYVYAVALTCDFDDCLINVSVEKKEGSFSAENEIDVVFTKDNKLGICSCKVKKRGDYKEHLSAYQTLADELGGVFSKAIFVSGEEEIPKSAAIRQRAELFGIEIIGPGELSNLQEIFNSIEWESL